MLFCQAATWLRNFKKPSRPSDIFIVRAKAPSAQEATEESGQLLAIGHFDGEKVEMAMYDEIKHILHDKSES